MRITAILAGAALLSLAGCEPQKTATAQTMEIGCAKCVYKVEGLEDCAPAVKVEGKTVLMEGSGVDAKALMAAGVCKAARNAEVEGKMEGEKFVATSVKVLGVAKEAAEGAAKEAEEGAKGAVEGAKGALEGAKEGSGAK